MEAKDDKFCVCGMQAIAIYQAKETAKKIQKAIGYSNV